LSYGSRDFQQPEFILRRIILCFRTIEEINDKIRTGSVVVVTAEEIIGLAREKGIERPPVTWM